MLNERIAKMESSLRIIENKISLLQEYASGDYPDPVLDCIKYRLDKYRSEYNKTDAEVKRLKSREKKMSRLLHKGGK